MDAIETTPVTRTRLAIGATEAAEMLGIGRTLFLQADKTGEIGPMCHRIGGRRLWSVRELEAWAANGMPPRGRWIQQWSEIVRNQKDPSHA